MLTWFITASALAVISYGLISGFFLTFSDFLIRSLMISKASSGIKVMQIINREIWKSITMFLLWGMVAISISLAGYAYFNITGMASTLAIMGGSFYIFGVLVVTFVFNVPMNNHLDNMHYSNSEAAAYWHDVYVPRWVFWNYIRAISSGCSAICFLIIVLQFSNN